jgi:hypothetical protein
LNYPSKCREKRGSGSKAAQNAAQCPAENPISDPRLQAMIDAWPTLPEAIRASIMGMIGAAPKE